MATFTKRGDRWRAEVRRAGKSASKTFALKRDAEAWAKGIEAEAERSGAGLASKPTGTVRDLIDRYETAVYPIKKWGVSKQYELAQLKADLGHHALAEIDRQAVVDYATALRVRMAGAGARSRLSYLVEVMRAGRDLWGAAVPLEEVQAAVAGLIRQKMLARAPARTRKPQADEIDRIIAYARASNRMETDLPAILEVLRLVPLRVGELLGIEWADLREAERAVLIKARKHPDSTVKQANDQVVPLPVIAGVDTYALVAGRPRYLDRPFPFSRPVVSSSFWVAAKACGIADLHLHDLRALAISRLLAAGVPLPVVAHMSGHRNWRTLAKHYSRMETAEMHQALAKAGV